MESDIKKIAYNLSEKDDVIFAKKTGKVWELAVVTERSLLDVMQSLNGYDKNDYFSILSGRYESGALYITMQRIINEEY